MESPVEARPAAVRPASGRAAATLRAAMLGDPVGLGAALAVAAVLRLVLLAGDGFWFDEGYSVWIAAKAPLDMAREAVVADTHPPLYYLLLHYWLAAFGDSELAVRLLSAVMGIALVPIAYALGRELGGRRAAIGAALLVAVMPILVEHSQEARMYGLLSLTSTASYLCLVGLEREAGRARIALYALTTAAMLYSHVYGIFVLAAQVAYLLVRRSRSAPPIALRPFALGLSGAAVLFAPWAIGGLARQAGEELGDGNGANLRWLDEPGLEALRDTAAQWIRSEWAAENGWIALAAGAAVLAGALVILRATPSGGAHGQHAGLLLGLWVVVPIALPFAFSQVSVNLYHPRYTISSAVAGAILLAVALARLRPQVATAALGLSAALLLAGTIHYYRADGREDWRSAGRLLEASADPGDLVIPNPWWTWPVLEHYYGDSGRVDRRYSMTLPRNSLLLAEARGGKVWLVNWSPNAAETEVVRELEALYGPPARYELRGLDVLRFDP